MVWNKQRMKVWVTMCVMAVVMTACSISYQFNGSSIDLQSITHCKGFNRYTAQKF